MNAIQLDIFQNKIKKGTNNAVIKALDAAHNQNNNGETIC